MDTQPIVRSANKSDRNSINDFLESAAALHRHLDWRTPFDWLGHKQFLISEENQKIISLLICTAEPNEVYWLRVFGSINFSSLENNWRQLFNSFISQFENQNQQRVFASIAYFDWMKNLLDDSQWEIHQNVVQLKWTDINLNKLDKFKPDNLIIRPMEDADLVEVSKIDRECFKFIWQQSKNVMFRAFKQSSYTRVAMLNGEIAGFQISSSHKSIAHLIRLAVSKKFQRLYIGQALVDDILRHFRKPWIREITVNTQEDNQISLNLYKKMGFVNTGDSFPIYIYKTG